MPDRPPCRRRRRARPRPAFSFLEVLFAIAILGVGFVMTAAMFPVVIRQTQATMDDAAGASVARAAVAAVGSLTADQGGPGDPGAGGGLSPVGPGLGAAQVCATDPRYGWAALIRRGGGGLPDGTAVVHVFVVRARNAATFGPADLTADPDDVTGLPANLEPRAVGVRLEKGRGGAPDVCRLTGGSAADTAAAAAPGAYLVVAGDGGDPDRVYQLGNPVDAAGGAWELAPGSDLRDAAEATAGATGFLIGRGYAEPGRPGSGFAGPAQDVAVYTAIVRLP